jgi:hypothetical protein
MIDKRFLAGVSALVRVRPHPISGLEQLATVLDKNRTMSALHAAQAKRYNYFNFNSCQGPLNTTGHALPAGT